MSRESVEKIYNYFIEHCGASKAMKNAFIEEYAGDKAPSSEWRISGKLGYGCKFILTSREMLVTCYSEDDSSSRSLIMNEANKFLATMPLIPLRGRAPKKSLHDEFSP